MTFEAPQKTRIYCVKDEYTPKFVPVLEMYESYSGWYWYITEKESTPMETMEGTFGIVAYGLVRGNETEWGEIWMPEIEDLIKRGKVWKVPRENWFGNSFIKGFSTEEDLKKENKRLKKK